MNARSTKLEVLYRSNFSLLLRISFTIARNWKICLWMHVTVLRSLYFEQIHSILVACDTGAPLPVL